MNDQPANTPRPADDDAHLRELSEACDRIRARIGDTIVGQTEVVDLLLASIFAGGHCILEGVPGLAKTLLVSTVARSLSLSFARIQFTPDLMPSDITGTEVIEQDRTSDQRVFRFVPGPIFHHVILADEINRTPPKTQAALLEGMQERQVSAAGERHPLPEPFFVLATQNPIEQEGTYPLPEAQLDRFLMKVFVDYPTAAEERLIYRQMTGEPPASAEPVLDGPTILAAQHLVRRLPVTDLVLDYAMTLVRATRPAAEEAPSFVRDWVMWGAGPRAGMALLLTAKARAAMAGRPEVSVDDLRRVAAPVLRHRLVLNYNAEADGQTPDTVIRRLVETVPTQPAEPAHAAYERAVQP